MINVRHQSINQSVQHNQVTKPDMMIRQQFCLPISSGLGASQTSSESLLASGMGGIRLANATGVSGPGLQPPHPYSNLNVEKFTVHKEQSVFVSEMANNEGQCLFDDGPLARSNSDIIYWKRIHRSTSGIILEENTISPPVSPLNIDEQGGQGIL